VQTLRRGARQKNIVLGKLAARPKAKMKRAKKIPWDSAFFMERATPEWRQREREESEPPLKLKSQKFDMKKCLAAWRAIGVHNSASERRAGMERLERLRGRRK